MPAQAEPKTWVDVVGYRHEVVHTGVLAAVLESSDGPTVAEALTCRRRGEVDAVANPRREARLAGARGKADLTAHLRLSSGEAVHLAVETKVHSDGDRGQLERTTEGLDKSEGVFLAVGLGSLKLLARHAEQVSTATGVPWHWIGASEWLRIVEDLTEDDRPWLPAYKASLESWPESLGTREKVELAQLRWMNRLLQVLPDPDRWREIKTSRSGPLLSRFGWSEARSKDIYLEFMGHHDGRRVLCVKVGGGTPSEVEGLSERLADSLLKLRAFGPGGRGGGRSRTVAVTGDLGDETQQAVEAASEAINVLDELSLFGG